MIVAVMHLELGQQWQNTGMVDGTTHTFQNTISFDSSKNGDARRCCGFRRQQVQQIVRAHACFYRSSDVVSAHPRCQRFAIDEVSPPACAPFATAAAPAVRLGPGQLSDRHSVRGEPHVSKIRAPLSFGITSLHPGSAGNQFQSDASISDTNPASRSDFLRRDIETAPKCKSPARLVSRVSSCASLCRRSTGGGCRALDEGVDDHDPALTCPPCPCNERWRRLCSQR